MKHEEDDLSLDDGWHESEDALELSSPNMDIITIISYDHHHVRSYDDDHFQPDVWREH